MKILINDTSFVIDIPDPTEEDLADFADAAAEMEELPEALYMNAMLDELSDVLEEEFSYTVLPE